MKNFLLAVAAIVAMASSGICSTVISLDGDWNFAVDSSGTYTLDSLPAVSSWRVATVPLSWQEQFSDLRTYQGVAWYRKEFVLPRVRREESVILHFGAVDYYSVVYVNGKPAGEHEGGYLPFDLDITALVGAGTNTVVVRVMDPSTSPGGTEGIKYQEIPHGKQSWYVQTSGIWQSVYITLEPGFHFTLVHVTPSIDGNITIDAVLSEPPQNAREERCAVALIDPSRREILRATRQLTETNDTSEFKLQVKDPLLWGIDAPNLYSIRLILASGDTVVEQFGFRSFETKDGEFYLNGKPIYLMGALDQDFYPGTGYTPPSLDYIRDEMMKARRLGLNLLRCHIKVPDPRYLEAADETGILVWYEIPNWDTFTSQSASRGIATFDGMLDRDWNHPSVVMISLINESWGIDLRDSTERRWLLDTYDYAKSKATGRLIEDNSPCCDNFHMKSDIADWHTYWSIPDNMENFRNTVREVASRPKWLFSSYGDGQPTGKEPLMISEFGNWGLPEVPADLPWWLRKPFGSGIVMPDGVRERFMEYKLDGVFKSYDSLAMESQRAQFDAIKYEIEEIRLQPQIQGYVITEFTDINWECNGLMNMWRKPKEYASALSDIQKQDVIIPRPESYNYTSRDVATIRLYFSHYTDRNLTGGWIDWTAGLDGAGKLDLPAIANEGVTQLSALDIRLPEVSSPVQIDFRFEVKDASGNLVAVNTTKLYVYPSLNLSGLKADVYDPDSSLPSLDSKFPVYGSDSTINIMLTGVLDSTVLKNLRSGENVICFVNDSTRLPDDFPFRLAVRDTGGYDGNWASNMNWMRTGPGPFAGLNFGNRLGFESSRVAAHDVLANIDGKYFDDVLAGMYVGWIHLNSSFILQMRVGKGKLILCTLQLPRAIDSDPYARYVLLRMTNYIGSNLCSPALTLSNN